MTYVYLTLSLILTISLQSFKVNCMINGIVTTSWDFPSTVIVKFSDGFYCGGSVILATYVLTSGVCASNRNSLEGVGVNFVDLFEETPGQIIPIDVVFIHPYFKMGNTTAIHDIALIKLKRQIIFTKRLSAIPIYSQAIVIGLNCETAGWGMVNDGLLTKQPEYNPWPAQNVLRKSTQVIVDIRRCQELLEKDTVFQITKETHICARGIREKQGPAFGDFGGPLICKQQQAAITTNSLFDPQTEHLYTVYTPIYSNLNWIKGIISLDEHYNIFEQYALPPRNEKNQTSYQNALMINNKIFIIIPILQGHISILLINFTLSLIWKVCTPLTL